MSIWHILQKMKADLLEFADLGPFLSSGKVPETISQNYWFKFETICHDGPGGGAENMRTTKRYGRRADLALTMWVKLARASATFSRLTARDIEQYGLTQPQFGVLEMLGHLGPLTTGEISKRMLVTAGCITVILDNLEKGGLVERVRSGEDRRVINVQLTARGQTTFKRVFPKHAKRVTGLASVLTEEEQIHLSDLLKKLGIGLKDK
jgi:MarR family 2-MHQ and catechol resistance regulon transcriptional repressor